MERKYGERLGDWIQTYTGRQFWPLDPRPEEIFIEDIAHALSMLCRYGGHCEWFYPVGQHSVYVMHQLPPEYQLWGLMHDAAEAYLVDVPRPVKVHLYEYKVIEQRLEKAIAQRFGFPEDFATHKIVKDADNSVLLAEKMRLMKQPPKEWEDVGVEPARVTPSYWGSDAVKKSFLHYFHALGGRYA